MDIHGCKERYDRALQNVKDDKGVPRKNKDIIIRFSENCLAEGISHAKVQRYVYDLRLISNWLGKTFDKATIADIKKVVAQSESSDYAEWTKHGHRVCLKKFYKWLRNTEDSYPDEVRWMPTGVSLSYQVMEKELWELYARTQNDSVKLGCLSRIAILYEKKLLILQSLGIVKPEKEMQEKVVVEFVNDLSTKPSTGQVSSPA